MAADDKEENPNPDPDAPVNERLCQARQNTLREEIRSLKLAIYAVGTTIVIALSLVQVILKLTLG